ncbi:MAG: hypothetical protein IKS49_01830 [Actinomycetaceae bacterium]|nr:hypothetical protein [Actinomycetaceae bacterium]
MSEQGEQTKLRVPSRAVYVALVLCVVAVCLLALFVSPLIAVWTLSFLFIIYGFAQLLLPRGVLPQVRSRLFDALCCFLLAAGLALFAQWASTPQIV